MFIIKLNAILNLSVRQWRAQTSSGAGVERPKRALDFFVVVVVILSFHDILRKYIELESEQLECMTHQMKIGKL